MYSKFRCIFFVLALFFQSYVSCKNEPVDVDRPFVLQSARQLPCSGRLKVLENGYVYLKVHDYFITRLCPLISAGVVPATNSIGGHISVFYKQELETSEIETIKTENKVYQFAVDRLCYIKSAKRGKKTHLYLLQVSCPGLERLRKSYGYTAKLKGHEFHITLGYESTSTLAKKRYEAFACSGL